MPELAVAEPERLVRRPHRGRLPVPFVSAWADGVPDFKTHDHHRRRLCAHHDLCQLCGNPLDPVKVFIGFPWALNRLRFGEPPMHEDCMEFAWAACPWLATAHSWRQLAEGTTFADRPPTVPQAMVVAWCEEYGFERDDAPAAQGRDVLVWTVPRIDRFETRRRGG